ncbi:MAG: hypothetical protein MUC59_06975 [Saprospiraceae bacterium]|nr:hypothetical protein [Saprospiraceae bacterium]
MNRLFFAIPLLCFVLATTGCQLLDDDDFNTIPNLDATVPAQVQDFIADNYNSLPIAGSGMEDVCDSLLAYEVELENGPGPDIDLYFDLPLRGDRRAERCPAQCGAGHRSIAVPRLLD